MRDSGWVSIDARMQKEGRADKVCCFEDEGICAHQLLFTVSVIYFEGIQNPKISLGATIIRRSLMSMSSFEPFFSVAPLIAVLLVVITSTIITITYPSNSQPKCLIRPTSNKVAPLGITVDFLQHR